MNFSIGVPVPDDPPMGHAVGPQGIELWHSELHGVEPEYVRDHFIEALLLP